MPYVCGRWPYLNKNWGRRIWKGDNKLIKVITAIGNEELNNILKKEEVIIESPDIQYQEGIIEALEKYPDTNIIILNENIIGNLETEELIRNIVMIKNDIRIILLCNKDIY